MDLIEEIKNRINIVDLANQLGLRVNGSNFILSIYKDESHPSLKFYPETNSYYCFATGRGGDVIKFYADVKGITNKEAIKILSEESGLSNWKITKFQSACDKSQADRDLREGTAVHKSIKKDIMIYESLEKICNGVDEEVKNYLTEDKRGLTEEIIEKFRLFSIKNSEEVINYLLSVYSMSELTSAGLFNDTGKFIFAKYRLIIPYLKENQIVYLRGRLLPKDENMESGKYIGLPGKAAKRFFNEDELRNKIEGAEILITEGEFDTIRACQEGIKAVGVPGVNNFPEYAKEILKKFEVAVCFDNDSAGKEGLQKTVNLTGKKCWGFLLEKHKDLTDYFNESGRKDLVESELLKWEEIRPERKSKLRLISAKEIQALNLPPIKWIVKELLPEGLTILAGRPKSGKSFMAQNIALSVSRGTTALGKFETERSSVLYIALEDNFRRIQDRIKNIIQNEIEKAAPENLYYLKENKEMPKLNDGGIEELQKLIEEDPEIKLIIVDTFGRSIADKRRMDSNSYRADYEIASRLQEFAIQNNICVLLIHHTKKLQEEDVFNEISGTSGITGAMDTMFVLKKKGEKGKLHINGRDVKDMVYNLVFDDKLCCWNVVEEEKNMTAERKEIFDVLKDFGRTMKTSEIAGAIGKELSNVSKMLGKMVKEGMIESPKYGHYKLPGEPEGKKKKERLKLVQMKLPISNNNGKSGKSAAGEKQTAE